MNLTRQPIRQKVRITKARDPRHLDMVRAMSVLHLPRVRHAAEQPNRGASLQVWPVLATKDCRLHGNPTLPQPPQQAESLSWRRGKGRLPQHARDLGKPLWPRHRLAELGRGTTVNKPSRRFPSPVRGTTSPDGHVLPPSGAFMEGMREWLTQFIIRTGSPSANCQ